MTILNAGLLDRWTCVLDKNRTQPALIGTDGIVLATFQAIEDQSRRWEAQLRTLPARAAVGIQLGNHPEWPSILLALWRKNQIAIPLDSSLRKESTDDILRAASAHAVIIGGELVTSATLSPGDFQTATSLCKVTSGTSGAPRLIEFSSDQLVADSDNICATMGLTSEDVSYGAIPFSHSYGFSNLLMPLLAQGIPLVVADDYLPHSLLDGMTNTKATVLPGVPVLYETLSRLAMKIPDTVRLCITAGAPLNTETAELFFQLNNRKIHSFYGASECGGISYDASENVELPAGFVGQPLSGVEVLQIAETKKIVVCSRAVGLGYYPERQADVLSSGEFRPQDLVECSGTGLRIIGRESDFINITGKKLDPQIVEAVIAKMPGVRRVVVFGIPHERRGELTVAAVEAKDLDPATILAACRKSLASWQVPGKIWLCPKIPITQRGKTDRRALSEVYLADRVSPAPSGVSG